MIWSDWHEPHVHCVFSRERAAANLSFLRNTLTDVGLPLEWPQQRGHFQQLWHTAGVDAFIQVNWLAEDIRLLHQKPGIPLLLRDLLDERLCESTWHTIHTAALFERARPGSVSQFIHAGASEAPDFVVEIEGKPTPVEAKLLTRSDDELRFYDVATRVEEFVTKRMPAGTLVTIVLRAPVAKAYNSEAVLDFCSAIPTPPPGHAMIRRGPDCNLFVEHVATPSGLSDYRLLWVLAPAHPKENARVQERAKKASKQLRSYLPGCRSGVVAIGLTDYQDGHAVLDAIFERMRQGYLEGISAVLLVKRRTHSLASQQTTIDLLELRNNALASSPLTGELAVKPFGSSGVEVIDGVRAYRKGGGTARVVDPSKNLSMYMPNIRILTEDMLAG